MKVITMRIQDFKNTYAGLFVVMLLFAVACESVVSNVDADNNHTSMSITDFNNSFDVDLDDVVYCGEEEVVSLTAGQYIDVGSIVVGNDGEYLYVTYKTTGDWYLTEVHLHVLDEDPERRLPPGRTPYKSDVDYEKEFTLKVPLSDFDFDFEEQCDVFSLWLQAHAVVKKIVDEEVVQEETAYGGEIVKPRRGAWYGGFPFTIKCCDEPCEDRIVIYGIFGENGEGGLYEIEIVNGSVGDEVLLASYNVELGDGFSGNGLAFDEVNNRLYFAAGSGSSGWNLYFYDFDGNIVPAASGLPGEIYGATWGAGKYWFIPNGTDDMYTVSFNTDGTGGDSEIFEEDIAGGKEFNFGDIALDAENLIIYGSTAFSGTNTEFFAYDLNAAEGSRYSEIVDDSGDNLTGLALGLQLGFAGDGNLYGHNTFGQEETGALAQEWFLVDRTVGSVLSLGQGENAYNDLTTGPSFICD